MSAFVDLAFPVIGPRLPTDHGYLLYSAISRLLPCVHDGSVTFGLGTVPGQYVGNGLLQLDPMRSRLRLRLLADDIPHMLALAGKGIEIMRHRIRLGAPHVRALEASPTLYARRVTIKHATEVGPFTEAARRKLDEIGIGGTLRVPNQPVKGGGVRPIRRVVRIKDVCVVAFAVLVEGLTVEESLRLQEVGLGGRRRMGCGFFVPLKQENTHDEV